MLTGCNTNKIIFIKIYGDEKEYFPLMNELVFNWIVNKINIIFSKIIVAKHLSNECKYILPTESWKKCDFYECYKNHCLEEINNDCKDIKYDFHIIFNINNIILNSYSILDNNIIKFNIFNVLSEWYFKLDDNNIIHFTELNNDYLSYLYKHLSLSYKIPIIDAKDFNPNLLNIKSTDKIILIPSILNITNNKPIRNIYSQEERFNQTLDQVKSVYNKCENAFIILLELSYISMRQIYLLSNYCKSIVFFNKDSTAQKYSIDNNKNKSEVYLQRFIYNKLKDINYSHMCKFGGRYKLSNAFSEKKIFRDRPVFKHMKISYDGLPIYESIFYSIPCSYHNQFEEILKIMENTLNFKYTDVEHLLYKCIQDLKITVYHTDVLGIKGNFAGNGIYNSS